MFLKVNLLLFLLTINFVFGKDVEKTVLLSSGHQMPVVGLGTGSLQGNDLEKALNSALDSGYRHIDTAFIYYNEKDIGKVLKKWFENGGKREDLFITSKLPFFGNHAKDVEKYLKLSLADLGIDYVDLYLVHSPISLQADETGLNAKKVNGKQLFEETIDLVGLWKAMEKQVKSGLTKSIGVSNFNKTQLMTVYDNAEIKPSNLQVEIHAYLQQRALREYCNDKNIKVTAYAPLSSPRQSKNSDKNLLDDPIVKEIANKYKKTPGQILLRHAIQGGLIVIPKSSNPDRLKNNIDLFDFKIDEEDVKKLNSLDKGEEGRVYTFKEYLPGVENYPFYPFQTPEAN